METEAELSRIIINEMSDQQVIILKERHGHRSFPIVIGIVEIFAPPLFRICVNAYMSL